MISPLTTEQLREEWPKSEDGVACANLLQRYFYAQLTEHVAGAECAERSEAEIAVAKAMAQMTRIVSTLVGTPPPRKPIAPMKPLHRFSPEPQPQPKTS